jgi:hypothetical protein
MCGAPSRVCAVRVSLTPGVTAQRNPSALSVPSHSQCHLRCYSLDLPRFGLVRISTLSLCFLIWTEWPWCSCPRNCPNQGAPHQIPDEPTAPTPNNTLIMQTANQVDQKSGSPIDALPNLDVAPTLVTVLDSKITNTSIGDLSSPSGLHRCDVLLDLHICENNTYNVKACMDWCTTVQGCSEYHRLSRQACQNSLHPLAELNWL